MNCFNITRSKTARPGFPTMRAPKWLSSSRAYHQENLGSYIARRREAAMCLRDSQDHTRNLLPIAEKYISTSAHMAYRTISILR